MRSEKAYGYSVIPPWSLARPVSDVKIFASGSVWESAKGLRTDVSDGPGCQKAQMDSRDTGEVHRRRGSGALGWASGGSLSFAEPLPRRSSET